MYKTSSRSSTYTMQLHVCEVKVINIVRTTSCNTWVANIVIEWLTYSNVRENKFGNKSELKVNLKIHPVNLLVFTHSACGL